MMNIKISKKVSVKQQLYFPSLAVYVNDVFHLHGHVVGKQRYDFRLFPDFITFLRHQIAQNENQ